MIIDNDLLSIQHARILAENAFLAQKKLATFTQEKLDQIVEAMAEAVKKHTQALAIMSYEETDSGKWQDKLFKNNFVCHNVSEHLKGLRCVGVISEDKAKRIVNIGVPFGVIVALSPITSPVSTTIYNALIAIKSGNAIIFSPHLGAMKSISKVLDIMIEAAEQHDLPKGCLVYLQTVTKSGTLELMKHSATSLVMVTGVPKMRQAALSTGKTVIYGGTGNGPAFIERSANIEQAVKDIISSKTFDNGIAPSAEQSIVVDSCISKDVKYNLENNGAYFMSEEESLKLAALFFCPNGQRKKKTIGLAAKVLAQRAGFYVPENTVVLVAERKYVCDTDPYSRELLAPVLAYYTEDDWMNACEKCIELLLHEKNAHSLVIHSNNEDVIMQFALKKPVGRLLVNTPAAFGGMGASTNLFPSMILGSGSVGHGITSDNVSPQNLIYIRKLGYGVRQINKECNTAAVAQESFLEGSIAAKNDDSIVAQALRKILAEAIEVINAPTTK